MKFCQNCGAGAEDNEKFCKACGSKLPEENAANFTYQDAGNSFNNQQMGGNFSGQQAGPIPSGSTIYVASPVMNPSDIPEEYKPISMWGYFGYEILFSIPLVGFILLCIFAFGGTKNKNVKNFARSYFCFFIVVVIAIVVFWGAFAGGVAGSNLF